MVCSGTTGRQVTDFQLHRTHFGENSYVDVDISRCGFVKIPNIVISVEGSGAAHHRALGTSSVHNATPTGFRVYLQNAGAEVHRSLLNTPQYQWNIDWIAVGFTC